MRFNHFNQLTPHQLQVLYNFQIIKYEVFQSRSYQRYLKLIFYLSNENESFEIDQLFELYDDDSAHPAYYRLLDQFRQFGEVKNDVTVEDLIGERGTCYVKHNYSNGKTYQQIILTSWEDTVNE